MKEIHNLTSKNIKDFTSEDTLYIPNKDTQNKDLFLCSFISYDENKKIVTGRAIKSTVNESLYTRDCDKGLELTSALTNCRLYGAEVSDGNWPHYNSFNSLGFALDPIEEEKVAANKMHIDKHPSFGMIGATRTTGSARTLFGSSIQHGNTIRITIKTAEHDRSNHSDYIHGRNNLIEVELSAVQFAEFITSMNVGDGVPCTLKYVNGKSIEQPPLITKGEIFQDEFTAEMHNMAVDMKKLISDAMAILKTKTTITKGDKEIIIGSIEKLSRELNSNIPFMNTSFKKQMSKTVLEAKAEVESFIENKIRSTGIAALNNPDVVKQLQENSNL